MAKRIMRFVTGICLLLSLIWFSSFQSRATSEGQKARVVVKNFSVSEDGIVPGEKFELTLKIKNMSQTDRAKSILITFTNDINTVYTVYGQSDQVYISELAPQQEETVVIKLKAAENLMQSTVRMDVNFLYEDSFSSSNTNSASIQLPVTTKSKFEMQNISIPETINAGEKVRIRITYKNTGADDFYNITMNVSGDETTEAEQYSLGSLAAGKVSYAETYVTFENTGEQKIKIKFSYEDIEGNRFDTKQYEQQVRVSKNKTETSLEQEEVQNITFSEKYTWCFLVVCTIVMAVVTFRLYKKYEK